MDKPASVNVHCSAVVFRGQDVLLVCRDRDGGHDWVLPGGTPRPGESMAACARRETLEETGPGRRVDLRPPIAGHLRGLHAHRQSRTAA